MSGDPWALREPQKSGEPATGGRRSRHAADGQHGAAGSLDLRTGCPGAWRGDRHRHQQATAAGRQDSGSGGMISRTGRGGAGSEVPAGTAV